MLPKMQQVRDEFSRLLKNEEFVIDKTGVKTVELTGITLIADDNTLFGDLNHDYARKELEWYKSQSLNVYDLPKTPKIWRMVADKDGNINSNYGWVIYSKENGEQYKNCVRTLRKDKDSRRAMMIYTRPSMQTEYNKNGMSDFMCTNNVQALIRNDKLVYIINQRSCDAIFGFKNDLFWHKYVQRELVKDLKEDYPELEVGEIQYQFGSLHVYERHFNLIK